MLAFYVDESGSFDAHNEREPWAVLLAVGFDDRHWLAIDRSLVNLKERYFPGLADSVEIRSNDIRMAHAHPRPENRFSRLESAALRGFGSDLYDLIGRMPLWWSAVVMHTPALRRARSARTAQELFDFGYRRLLALLDRWCSHARMPGRLFLDQRDGKMQGAVHRGIASMHDEHRRTSRVRSRFHVVERPYFHDSAKSNHIQLADVIAYNVLRRFRNGDPSYEYWLRVLPKLQRFGSQSESGLSICGPRRPHI